MAAKQYNFSIEQGSSFRLSLTYKDNNSNIIDLTGYCARILMKIGAEEFQTFSTLNTDFSEYKFIIDGPQGTLNLLIPANITNSYTFNSAKYDLELQSPQDLYIEGGKYTIRVLYGTISIIKRFSQSSTMLDCSL
jgi:hypothetical protein